AGSTFMPQTGSRALRSAMLSAMFEILENRTFGAGVAVAMRDQMREAAAHRAQLGDLAIERLEVRGGERLYRPARALLVAPKIEQPAYLVDGKAKLARALDEVQLALVGRRIGAIAIRQALGLAD